MTAGLGSQVSRKSRLLSLKNHAILLDQHGSLNPEPTASLYYSLMLVYFGSDSLNV